MDMNPYAPPVAPLSQPVAGAVALWNPGAAASWSLLFTPAFGAYLHMRNWQALGENDKAEKSKLWMIGAIVATLALQVVGVFSPAGDVITRAGGLGLLFGWYFGSAKTQVSWVKDRYGVSYQRRSWSAPLGIAFAILLGLALLVFGAVFVVMGVR